MLMLTHNTLPGTDQACFQTADIESTPRICAVGTRPDCAYVFRSRPSWAKSESVVGHANVIGSVDRQRKVTAVESGNIMMTSSNGA